MVKSRIMIVEDEQIVARELANSLQAQGYETSVAGTGEKAIEQASASMPNLVLLDIVLPGTIDGISVAEQMQVLKIPVVYMTGYADGQLFDRARHTEPLAYLIKPLNSGDLQRVIQLALLKHEQETARERERRQQARELRISEERFLRVVEQVTEYSIFTLDLAGRVSSWNSGAERIMGYKADEVLGHDYGMFFSADDQRRNAPAEELEQALVHGSADDTRWLVRKDGQQFWAEGSLTGIRNGGGRLTGFTKVSRDTTERWRMEETLREREERLRVALQAARTGTWRWDLRTNRNVIDDGLRKLFGLRPDQKFEIIEDFYAIVHPEERVQVKAAFERTVREGVHLDTEFRVIRPDGTERWLLDQGKIARDQDGNPAYLTGACVDVTERKESERALRTSLHEKEVLLQEIHHRVKNNLQVITSLLRLQSEHAGDGTRAMFEEARNRVQVIGGIHELLYHSPDLAHIDFGAYLNRLVRDLFSFYGIEEDRLSLEIEVDHTSLEIGQAIPCGLIVNELVTNCLKHAFPDGRRGTVRLTLDCDHRACILVVEDNGVGMPEAFDWEQGESLGLQLVQVLTKQLDGAVKLIRGLGTRFEVSFESLVQ